VSPRLDSSRFHAWRRRQRLTFLLGLGEVFLGLYAFTCAVLSASVLVSR